MNSPEPIDVTHYDAKLGEWVSESGTPVCQDHIWVLSTPCPFKHGRRN